MYSRCVIVAFIALCFIGSGICAQNPKRIVPLVRQVDHILVNSSDPGSLFNFFAETLQLPIAWSLTENQGYISGGIGLGNVNLEIFRYTNQKGLRAIRGAGYTGLAFEPLPLDRILPELQARGVRCGKPEPTIGVLPNGSSGIAWTTVALPALSRPAMAIFLYEYSPAFLKVDVRRKQQANRLMLNKGGPLGFISAAEILIGSKQVNRDKNAWSFLLGSASPSGQWNTGPGLSIRMVEAEEDRIQEITLRVESLQRARDFLQKKKLLGSATTGRISFRASSVQGLRVSLVAR